MKKSVLIKENSSFSMRLYCMCLVQTSTRKILLRKRKLRHFISTVYKSLIWIINFAVFYGILHKDVPVNGH